MTPLSRASGVGGTLAPFPAAVVSVAFGIVVVGLASFVVEEAAAGAGDGTAGLLIRRINRDKIEFGESIFCTTFDRSSINTTQKSLQNCAENVFLIQTKLQHCYVTSKSAFKMQVYLHTHKNNNNESIDCGGKLWGVGWRNDKDTSMAFQVPSERHRSF
jgi:hypothetical protein